MASLRTRIAVAAFVAAAGAGHAVAGMTGSPFWHWETVTINEGESYHFHFQDFQLQGEWTDLWIEWNTPGTAHIELNTKGTVHLDPGASAHVHIHGSVPFVDWEKFTNIGNGPQTLHGQIEVGGSQGEPFWIETQPGESADIHFESGPPNPTNGQFEASKWFTNESTALPQWWEYSSMTRTWLAVDAGDSMHLSTHFEQLIFTESWLWIENDGDGPITFTVHYHIPAPGALALAGLAGLTALRRRR